MANSLTLTANINGVINNDNVGPVNSTTQLVPSGSLMYNISIPVNTGAYQQVVTGSNIGSASVFYIANTSSTGSIAVAVSASGTVSNLGFIPAQSSSNTPNASLIQWGAPFAALYATNTIANGAAIFIVTTV
jgi:hypothetical protein